MTNFKSKIKYIIAIAALLMASTAFAVNITVPQPTAWGDVLRGTGANGVYTPVATSTLGLPTFGWPFTVNTGYNSTSTTIGFLQGLFSNASSTFSSALRLSSLTQGYTYIGTNGLVGTISTSTLASNLTSNCSTITGGSGLCDGVDDTSSGGNSLASSTPWTFGNIVTALTNGTVTTISTSTLVNNIFPFTTWGGFGTTSVASFNNGLLSLSSTTINGLKLTDLSQGAAYVGSNGKVNTQATSTCPTFSTGLTYSGTAAFCLGGTNGNVTVNTSQNISTLSNLTTNGLVTTSGGTGALSVTANSTNGFVLAMSAGVPTWVATTTLSTITGTLAVNKGGTGLTTFGGTNTILYTTAADTLSSETAFTYNPSTNLLTFDYSTSSIYSSFARASTTALHVGSGQGYGFIGSNGLFGVISTSTLAGNLTSSCSTITGGSGLCDGVDDTGVGGSGNATSSDQWILYKQGNSTNLYNTISRSDVLTGTSFSAAMNFVINAATSTYPGQNTVFIREGYYSCDSTIVLDGMETFIAPALNIKGIASSTIIAADTPSCFLFKDDARINAENLHIAFKANSNSFFTASSSPGLVQASIQNSSFTNIYGFSTTTGHTGYLFDFIADFRNNYTNVSVNNTGNMIRSRNTYTTAQFINGDSHWIGFSFCEINNSGTGTCFDLDGGTGGRNNQWVFDDINGISNDSGAGSNDIFFRGNRLTRIKLSGLNMEQFATSTQITASNGVYVESTKYINPTSGVAGKAIFSVTDTGSANIVFSCKEVEVSAATTILYDKNTDRTQPTVLQGVDGGNCVITNDGGSALYATSTASLVRDIDDDATGVQWLARVKILGDKIALAWSESVDTTLAAIGNTFRLVVAGVEMLNISSTGVSISDDADGAITFTGVSTGNDESLTWNYDDGTANTVGVSSGSGVTAIDWGTVGADYDSVSVTLSSLLGLIDAGGATSFEIPNGTSNTSTAVGQVYFDTTDNQLVVATSTVATSVAIPLKMKLWSGTVASTSVDFVSGGRIPLNSWSDGVIITEIRCQSDAGTSKAINLDTLAGGSNTDSVTCATTETSDTAMSANYNIAAGTSMAIELGATTGSVDYVTFSVWGYTVRE